MQDRNDGDAVEHKHRVTVTSNQTFSFNKKNTVVPLLQFPFYRRREKGKLRENAASRQLVFVTVDRLSMRGFL